MNNPQRFVLTALVIAVLLDIGSFSKFTTIWNMAFSAQPSNGTPGGTTVGTSAIGAATGHTAPYQGPPPKPGQTLPTDKSGNCPDGMTAVLGFCIPNWMLGLPQVAP